MIKEQKLQQWSILAKDGKPYEIARQCSKCGQAVVLAQEHNQQTIFEGDCDNCATHHVLLLTVGPSRGKYGIR